jgi:hypothetical protein
VIRLTGKHPLNVEPPVSVLNQQQVHHNTLLLALRAQSRGLSALAVGYAHGVTVWAGTGDGEGAVSSVTYSDILYLIQIFVLAILHFFFFF